MHSHPLLSPSGLLVTLALALVMGFFLWWSGGEMFSAGPLSEKGHAGVALQGFSAHSEFEQACAKCHQPLDTRQAFLCLDCHTTTNEQIVTKTGLHGAFDDVLTCMGCHPDHRGRAFDLLADPLPNFNHQITGFDLVHHQIDYNAAPLACVACHAAGDFSTSAQACVACHQPQAPDFMALHIADFGEGCVACHDGRDALASFDHQSTRFALSGQHALTRCALCHEQGRFESTPLDCVSCHAEPATHQGLFGVACETCHTLDSWAPSQLDGLPFDHAAQAGFSLARHAVDYAGQPLTCATCHQSGFDTFDPQTCTACHAAEDPPFMQTHQDQFGPSCLACHDGIDRLSHFDHAAVFPLDGQHAPLECAACHAGRQFRDTPTACAACHAEPAIHAGVFGLECHNCHTVQGWVPAQLRFHAFPLGHGEQGEVACSVCHTTTYTEYTCYGCHEHQPGEITSKHLKEGISRADLPNCTTCHPAGLEGDD